ncbi:MAG TPA: hypothetical protein VGP36_07930 [Mycobacteriales bacterium]|jgi:hypothetical protein|nr:hypothetical protein [Mycobacteriales bacterium]
MSGVTLDGPSRRRTVSGLIGVLVLGLLLVELLVWQQSRRPTEPAGAVPASGAQLLAEQHGCRVPQLWGTGPAAGVLIGSTDPGRPQRVAWVPAADIARWQPAWQTRQWCTR